MKNSSGLHPLGVAVLVEPPEADVSVIYIPDPVRQALKILENRVRVIEVGPEAWKDESQPRAKPGDVVIITKHAGAVANGIDGKLYRVVNDRDCYLRVEEAT
jgi:co-chaperonin GroES (HSP10)